MKKTKKTILDPNLEYVKCNYCDGSDYDVLYRGIPDEKEGNAVKKYKSSGNEITNDRIVKCKNCGLIYVNPRLKGEKIVNGYSKGSDERHVSQEKGRAITFNRSLKYIEKMCRKYKVKQGRILDIGTAGGTFLNVAKERGWKVYGIEPNKWLCNWGKKRYGIDIKPGTIEQNKFPGNYFDVVCLWDVLEHVPDPAATLKECNRIMKKGGLLVVNYPDIGSWIAKAMKKRWIFLLTVHLFYFTPKTIKKMLSKYKFRTAVIKPHFQTLSLGYLALRMEPYSKFLHKVASKTTRITRTENIQIPYWLGQTLVLAIKEK